MGCCLSSPATNNQTPKSSPDVFPPPRRPHSPESDTDRRRAPPPPLLEEETVKEVLSETPIPKPFIPIANDNDRKRDPQQQPLVHEEAKIQAMAVMKPEEEIVSEVSEVSEMYSYSESLSAVTDKREDDGEVTQRVQRSPAKVPRKRPCSADPARGKERGIRSPARRSEPSPVKRNHVSPRSVQGPPATKTAGVRRNVGPPNAVRRDAGEGSGRRSRSPVIRGDVGAGRPERSKSPTPAQRTSSRPPVATAENGEERGKAMDETLPESLENPLVSLECFIFL